MVTIFDAFCDIEAEYAYATAKFPGNNDNLTALIEEVGELANALLEQKRGKKSHEDVYNEAKQVASMAVRIMRTGDDAFPDFHPESGYRGRNWDGYKWREGEAQCVPLELEGEAGGQNA